MNLKTLRLFRTQIRDNIQYKILISACGLGLIAAVIWTAGPYFSWHNTAFLASAEKRLYLILFFILTWLLKFFLLDLNTDYHILYKNKKMFALQKRFQGITHFLNTADAAKGSSLNKLPCYLLIGPGRAGKTTLLANSRVNFILEKKFPDLNHISSSENFDWWITREASIIDVPGKYISIHDGIHTPQQTMNDHSILWDFFLHLLKKERGKKGLNGIIIALPAPEILQSGEKYSQDLLKDIYDRIHEIQKIFGHAVPCQLIITKTDLLPGFNEFFAESSREEMMQAWGVTLPAKKNNKITEIFHARFNVLIKKINQQLIWRMHQERNPMLRPLIKDFPLQLERLKEFCSSFIKNFSSKEGEAVLQGVHLTSALQTKPVKKTVIDEPINHSARAIAIFTGPVSTTQAYFIKQLFTEILISKEKQAVIVKEKNWGRRIALAASLVLVLTFGYTFGTDFQQGMKKTYAIQQDIADYQNKIAMANDATERLFNTIGLLNLLKQPEQARTSKFTLSYLLSFYSHKANQQTQQVYEKALRTIFLREIKNYLEDYLLIPVNKNSDDVYAVLKAYLMFGERAFFNPDYISKTFLSILPKSISKDEIRELSLHLKYALQMPWQTTLNPNVVEDTRRYLLSQSPLKLSYIILKNIDNNNSMNKIDLGENETYMPIFFAKQYADYVPAMFTGNLYASIISQESVLAAQEAALGNWVLGHTKTEMNPMVTASLIEQLRVTYVNHYISAWENLLGNIYLHKSQNLSQVDAKIMNLISGHSPLLLLLKTLHSNTFFEPIISSSPKLLNLNLLVDKNGTSQQLLFDIFTSLQSLHQYLQVILSSENEKKAAFDAVSSRMLSRGAPDAITQLRMVAEKSPEPVKSWLTKLSNESWNFLMQESGRYLDISWQDQVYQYYQAVIANRYPFNAASTQELALQNFVQFFGNPGIITNFYNHYLQHFVDTSTADWHWKKMDAAALPFSEETLRQLQQAMRIHYSFFPNHDNKLYVKFALQPYKISKAIKSVTLTINDEQFVDINDENEKNYHEFSWPQQKHASAVIQLTLDNDQTITRKYAGNWGWLRLLNQSFESMLSKKELLINLSLDQHTVKYVLAAEGKYNPYLAFNLRQFHLPEQLYDEKVS